MQRKDLKSFMDKNMVYKINIIIISLILSVTLSHARLKSFVTKQLEGQEYYLKQCSLCHGSGNRGANLYSASEWKDIFSNNGKELYDLHDGEDDVEDVMKYIKSDKFKKNSKKMLLFIQDFAYDSDGIPTCN